MRHKGRHVAGTGQLLGLRVCRMCASHRLSFSGSGGWADLITDVVVGLRNWAVWQKFVEA